MLLLQTQPQTGQRDADSVMHLAVPRCMRAEHFQLVGWWAQPPE